jgi:hypothetical protein
LGAQVSLSEAEMHWRNTIFKRAPKGSRPRAIRQQQFEYAYIFGAACPAGQVNFFL